METELTLDTIVQGFTLVFCLILGCIVFFTDQLEDANRSNNSLQQLSTDLGATLLGSLKIMMGMKFVDTQDEGWAKFGKTLSYSVAFLLLSFIAGVFAHTAGDIWMDANNASHLGNKILWLDEDQLDDVSYQLKIEAFDAAYRQELDSARTIGPKERLRAYYYAKHELLTNEKFAPYLRESIHVVEYTQTFALSFFILYLFSFANFVGIQVRFQFKRKQKPAQGLERFISILFRSLVALSILALIVGIIGQGNEFVEQQIFRSQRIIVMCCALNLIPFWIWTHLWLRMKFEESRDATQCEDDSVISYTSLFFKQYFTFIFLYAGLLGYWAASTSWAEAESDRNKKTYGVYKNINESLREQNENFIEGLFD